MPNGGMAATRALDLQRQRPKIWKQHQAAGQSWPMTRSKLDLCALLRDKRGFPSIISLGY